MPDEPGVEIGGTKGQTHQRVLESTLGHERGLAVASGHAPHEPHVVPDDEDARPATPSRKGP